jgi:hypothetical protein
MINIVGYLIQSILESALKQLVGESNWRGRELFLPNSKRRWDMAYAIDGHTIIVVIIHPPFEKGGVRGIYLIKSPLTPLY